MVSVRSAAVEAAEAATAAAAALEAIAAAAAVRVKAVCRGMAPAGILIEF